MTAIFIEFFKSCFEKEFQYITCIVFRDIASYGKFKSCSGEWFKVGLSPSKQNSFYLLQWKPFNDEKCLFHLKSFFRSQDIKIFVLTFWLCNKGNITRQIFFLKNHAENEAGRLVPDHFLFFKKALFEVNASGLQLSFNQFR